MKRILTLALAAGMFMGASQTAEAADIKVSGWIHSAGIYQDNLGFKNDVTGETPTEFDVRTRTSVMLDIVNSEDLSAKVVMLASPSSTWGAGDYGVGGGDIDLELRAAYIDWIVPTTDIKVRMGMQPNLRTGFMGLYTNPVFWHNGAGIGVFAPINDMATFEIQWLRLADTATTTAPNSKTVSADYFYAQVPMKFDAFKLTPFAAYLHKGNGSGISADSPIGGRMNGLGEDTFWFGASTTVTFLDPFKMHADFVYSTADASSDLAESIGKNYDGNGWLADLALEYAHNYGTTALSAWYSQGQDSDGDNGQFGYIAPAWIHGSAFYSRDQFQSTALFPNSGGNPNASWAVMLSHKGFELAQGWHLGGHVMYVQGTNNTANVKDVNGVMQANGNSFTPSYLTTKDSMVELSAWTTYDIMKGLKACFELNYMIEDFDEDVWFTEVQQQQGAKFENGFRTNISFMYRF